MFTIWHIYTDNAYIYIPFSKLIKVRGCQWCTRIFLHSYTRYVGFRWWFSSSGTTWHRLGGHGSSHVGGRCFRRFPSVDVGVAPGGKGENPGNPGEDAFLLTNFCLMFMESSKIFQYICRKNVLNMSLEVNGRCPRFFPEWGNVGDKRPGSLVVSNDSLQHHFDLKRSWIIELESTNWQYLVNLIYATSSMFHMYIYIYLCFWHISNGDIASQNKTPCKLIESEKQKHDFNMTKSSLDWKCLKLQCEDNCWQVS